MEHINDTAGTTDTQAVDQATHEALTRLLRAFVTAKATLGRISAGIDNMLLIELARLQAKASPTAANEGTEAGRV